MWCLTFTVVVLHFTLKYFYWILCKIKEAMIIQTIVHLLVRQWVILNFIRPANQPLPRNFKPYNFSLRHPCIIQKTGNENTQTYQVEFVILIKHQILTTSLQGYVSNNWGQMYLNTKLNLVYKIYYEKNKYVHKLH